MLVWTGFLLPKHQSGRSPVFEGEHDGQQASAGVGQSLVAAGQKQDLVLRQSSTEQVQHVDYTWEEKHTNHYDRPFAEKD